MTSFLKIAVKILALLVVGLAPFAVAGAATGWSGVNSIAAFGFFVGLFATVSINWQAGIKFSAVFTVLGTLGAMSTNSPLAAALVVAAASALIAYFATKGQSGSMLIAAMFVPYLIHGPPAPWTGASVGSLSYNFAVAAALMLAGLWGLVIALILNKFVPDPKAAVAVNGTDALIAGALVAIVTGAITFVAMTWFNDTMWMWLLLTIFVLTKPSHDLNWSKTRDRTIGTLLGVAGASVIIFLGAPPKLMSAIGVLALATALTLRAQGRPYWVYASFMTPAVIMFDAIGANEEMVAADRLLYTVIGAVIALSLGAAINVVVHWAHGIRTESAGRPAADLAA